MLKNQNQTKTSGWDETIGFQFAALSPNTLMPLRSILGNGNGLFRHIPK